MTIADINSVMDGTEDMNGAINVESKIVAHWLK